MKKNANGKINTKLSHLFLGAFIFLCIFTSQSANAAFDYLFFSVNGDTTLSTMTQGDELSWGSNCDSGATINWNIWIDVNADSFIDTTIDVILATENVTDGNPLNEPNPILDGFAIGESFNLSAQPGQYIFKATDLATDSSLQKVLTMVAMSSPPNQFTGTITLPGISAPNSILANRIVVAESETGDEGAFLATTDNNGFYSINLGAPATGVEFFIDANPVPGFVPPAYLTATASGVIANNDFAFTTAVDSIWGYVKDQSGSLLPNEVDVSIYSSMTDAERYTTTLNGRYVIYINGTETGLWYLEASGRNSPFYLTEFSLELDMDTVSSFQHDITLTTTDAAIYAVITENGGLPVNNYRLDASSESLSMWGEAISGTGSDNVVKLSVSSLDASNWYVSVIQWDNDFPIPAGLILNQYGYGTLSPGDTVTFNFINGQLVSGTIVQDVGDAPIVWDNVNVSASDISSNFDVAPASNGVYSLYTSIGTYWMGAYADGYISNPSFRQVNVTGDTSSADLNFTINATHSTVSGTLQNVTLPLDASWYFITARTGTNEEDGYQVTAQVDSATGTYTMDLCDGDWVIIPPLGLPDVIAPDSAEVTIGEAPADAAMTVDFAYSPITGIEDEVGSGIPTHFVLGQNYPNPFNPSTEISFALPVKSNVEIVIYNTLGQEVRRLVNDVYSAGIHTVTWDGTNSLGKQTASGMYLYKITTEKNTASKKMLLLK